MGSRHVHSAAVAIRPAVYLSTLLAMGGLIPIREDDRQLLVERYILPIIELSSGGK